MLKSIYTFNGLAAGSFRLEFLEAVSTTLIQRTTRRHY